MPFPPRSPVFVTAYLSGRSIGDAIDPSAGYGQLITPLVEAKIVRTARAWESNVEAAEIGKIMSEGLPVEWHHGEYPEQISDTDLAICCPALGPPNVEVDVTGSGVNSVKARDSKANLTALKGLPQPD